METGMDVFRQGEPEGISSNCLLKGLAGERSRRHPVSLSQPFRLCVLAAKKKIRRRTEKAILAVSVACISSNSLVPAKRTWALVERLLNSGFTKKELARRLGYASSLQLNRKRVTALNASKVERFYNRIMR